MGKSRSRTTGSDGPSAGPDENATSSFEADDDDLRHVQNFESATSVIARLSLKAAVPSAVWKAIGRKKPIAILIETRSAAWTAAISSRCVAIWPHAEIEAPRKAPPRNTPPAMPKVNGAVIAISENRSWLASALVAGCDHRFDIEATPEAVAKAIAAVCGRSVKVTRADITGLDLTDLGFAIRRGTSPESCLLRLRRTVAARSSAVSDDATPPLERLVGYGAALERMGEVAASVERGRANPAQREKAPSVLLYGEPGSGKTTLVRSFAKTLSLPLVSTSAASWFSTTDGHLGDVAGAAQRFFSDAAAAKPSVAFLDELDAIPNRATLPGEHAAWWTTMVTGVLLGIDNLRQRCPDVVLLAATNHKDKLDAALIRPGRFDLHIEIKAPRTIDDLAAVLRQHLGDALMDRDVRLAAELGVGATGAMAESWVRAARRTAAAAGRNLVLADLVGVIAPAEARPKATILAVALHEAAHAVISTVSGIPVHAISIIETERSAGHISVAPMEGVYGLGELERRVVSMLAGRAADELFSSGPTSGAASDLAQATKVLAAIHCALGLGDTLVACASFEDAWTLLKFDAALKAQVGKDLARLMDTSRSLVARHEHAIRELAKVIAARRVAFPDDIERALKSSPRRSVSRPTPPSLNGGPDGRQDP